VDVYEYKEHLADPVHARSLERIAGTFQSSSRKPCTRSNVVCGIRGGVVDCGWCRGHDFRETVNTAKYLSNLIGGTWSAMILAVLGEAACCRVEVVAIETLVELRRFSTPAQF